MQTLNRSNLGLLERKRIKWQIKGLLQDKEEEVEVWVAKLSVYDMQQILYSQNGEDAEQLEAACKQVQKSLYDGDTSTLLFDSVEQLADAIEFKSLGVITNGILQANGLLNDDEEETQEVVKNVSSSQ